MKQYNIKCLKEKAIRLLIATTALMLLSQVLYAQEDYVFYLQKARQRLAEGDCIRAEQSYNTYKDLTGKSDASVERGIRDCQSMNGSQKPATTNIAPKPIEPFTVNYRVKRASYSLDRRDNAEAREMLVDKIASGDIIKGFKIDVWVGPDIATEHVNDLANAYANAVEKDLIMLLKKCNKDYNTYLFETNAHGVDWDTFLFLVENSNISNKDVIIYQLNNSSDKEETIESLVSIYPQLEKEILPLLRRVQVYVY